MRFYRAHVLVCSGTSCHLRGATPLRQLLIDELTTQGLGNEIKVVETGCFGLCEQGPMVVVYPEGAFYARVSPEDVKLIVAEHLVKGRIVESLLYREQDVPKVHTSYEQSSFFRKQRRVILRNCGLIDPESLEEYIARGGYEALGKVLTGMSAQEVIALVKDSGLRGRGGAGFPTGLKWQFTQQAAGNEKYFICNADEGEPGTFKDRLILEGDPHSIVEGMAIGGYATGASKGYVYVRGEYQLSIQRLQRAIEQAAAFGLLGDDIFGSGFSFQIEIVSGAGAYVCGEETALIESIEGRRGQPRYKPPYPATHGLFGQPTTVNNVETLANIVPIIRDGAAWYRSIGTSNSPGTKVFTITGNVVNTGLIEVPMGITLREVIFEVGGGIPNGRKFKMAQTGGTSGGCLADRHLDLPMDYDSLQEHGSALGSGALLVMDDSHCIVDVTKNFLRFFQHESCGQCTPCREGITHLYRLLDRISRGEGTAGDLSLIRRLSKTMNETSLCALGQTAPIPLQSTLRFFADEYEQHLAGRCPAGVCAMVDREGEK